MTIGPSAKEVTIVPAELGEKPVFEVFWHFLTILFKGKK